ncbi:hypothetical protein [Enterobacter bugandensis]|uniref:hypothetical protein n=1 Tax=Enterobacter bugandensis TaxID=881260 RepID=UPI002005052C|nr:hypothetical protein [Enterobacter bugandensis]MCK7195714.1 hypothetical protein [Enterobacter bugandensis]
MNKFDRKLQLEVMKKLLEIYPGRIGRQEFNFISNLFNDEEKMIANLLYLEGHGLISSGLVAGSSSYSINFGSLSITVRGIDFMQDDGGLSAILNVQTIKFHRDAVVVLEDLIAISNMNEAEKEKAKSTLGELSTEALKTVVQTATTALLAL